MVAPTRQDPAGDVAADGCRVLICDDVAAFRQLIGTALRRANGFDVVGEAGNGREAVDAAAAQHPDVMLLDIAMPVMDGIEALPLILSASPGTRVIMLTGFTASDLRQRALASGAAAYIEKGARPGAIIDAVREACAAS